MEKMEEQILISIVTPVYNKPDGIKKAIASALKNKSSNYEIIIVDDGSTDDSGKIVDAIAKNNNRIRVIHQENQWVYAAFNRGIREARGQYIYILNADDELYEGSIDLLEETLKRNNYPDVIWTRCMRHVGGDLDNNWRTELMDTGSVENSYYSNKSEVEKSWKYLFENRFVENQANLYRRDIALKHPFRNDVYAADGLFNIQIANDINTAFVLKEHVYKYYRYAQLDQNISNGKFYPYQHSMSNEIYEGHKRLFKEWDVESEEGIKVISRWRMNALTGEFNVVCTSACGYSTDEKVETIINKYLDNDIYECAAVLDANKELEGRVIFALRTLFSRERVNKDSKYYFIYEMVRAFHKFEKNKADMECIRAAVYDCNNSNHIGKQFLEELE